jgi:uncharacterized membrane protein YtjA (UPF0391 family)
MPRRSPRKEIAPARGLPIRQCLTPSARVTEPQQWCSRIQPGANVLEWAIIFFIVSFIAGYFGFGGVASGTRTIAKVLFFLAITIFLVVLIFGVLLGTLVF